MTDSNSNSSSPIDASGILAQKIAGLEFTDLPASAIEAARCNLLDTVGVAIAGASAPGCAEIVGLVLDYYPTEQATVWGSGRKATATEAAFANGTMAHALDFDDTHDAAILHAGVSVVPAALAIAETIGGVNGKQLINAVAIGLDITCRLGVAARISPVTTGWVYTAIFGLFGATIAVGKILRLNALQIQNAIGIAYAQAAGNCQCIPDGSLTKRMQPGFSARVGVLSALLAQRGITGTLNSFEGRHGLARVYLHNQWDRNRLLDDFGSRWLHEELAYKPYPACRHTHNAIDVALRLARDHDIDARQIECISVAVNAEAYANVCTPAEIKRAPRTVVDAQFSIPYCVANALLKRDVFITEFSEAALRQSDALQLASKVACRLDQRIDQEYGRGVSPAEMTITLRDGSTFSGASYIARGGIEKPMTISELEAKFERCFQFAHPDRSQGSSVLIDKFRKLDMMADVRELTSALA